MGHESAGTEEGGREVSWGIGASNKVLGPGEGDRSLRGAARPHVMVEVVEALDASIRAGKRDRSQGAASPSSGGAMPACDGLGNEKERTEKKQGKREEKN